ncbi:histone deacetylase family protein [Acidovorax sp. SUPP950]|nr:histone deacetylase family protein [Acidovorax sp. SUPP950]
MPAANAFGALRSATIDGFDSRGRQTMLTFHNPLHNAHAPVHEFFRGERVPCFEKPARQDYVEQRLKECGHALLAPNVDSTAVLKQIHAERYLSFLQTAWQQWLAQDPANAAVQPFPSVWPVRTLRSDIEPANFTARYGLYSMDNGTPLAEGTWAAAKAGADAAASAASAVASGVAGASFCVTRPPGHHAGPDFMGGYCFLNNAAVAAQTLRNSGMPRVAVLDVDYHHGNGTQSIFYERSDVLFISIHGDPMTEYPFYLGHADETGHGAGAGFNLNLPLPAGTGFDAWFAALEKACVAILAYGPQAVVVSLGLDTFEGDPISRFSLASQDFSRIGQRLAQLNLPTVFVLEGGYAAAELGLNAVNVIDGFEAQGRQSS